MSGKGLLTDEELVIMDEVVAMVSRIKTGERRKAG